MTRAEEAALKAYPELLSGSIFGPLPVDLNKASREKYQEGYEQALKDLALTVEDIKQIIRIHYYIVFKDETGVRCGDVAEEVLRRFNVMKYGKK